MNTIEEIRDHADNRHPELDHSDCPVCRFTLEQRKQTDRLQ